MIPLSVYGMRKLARSKTHLPDTPVCSSVAYSPDGNTIASGSEDQTVYLWDATTGALLNAFTGHTDWIESVAYSPDGTTIASGSGGRHHAPMGYFLIMRTPPWIYPLLVRLSTLTTTRIETVLETHHRSNEGCITGPCFQTDAVVLR